MYGKIIAITGKYGAGKDTVAGMIAKFYPEYKFQIIGFADGVRTVYQVLTGNKIPKEYTQEWKQEFNSMYRMTNRELLEHIGDGMRRIITDDVWIQQLNSRIRDGRNYIITDLRYPNELGFIHQKGGIAFRVDRPDNPYLQSNAPQNNALDEHDLPTLINSGSTGDLANAVIVFGAEVLGLEWSAGDYIDATINKHKQAYGQRQS